MLTFQTYAILYHRIKTSDSTLTTKNYADVEHFLFLQNPPEEYTFYLYSSHSARSLHGAHLGTYKQTAPYRNRGTLRARVYIAGINNLYYMSTIKLNEGPGGSVHAFRLKRPPKYINFD